MRRKRGELLPIETSILAAAVGLRTRGEDHFYGFALAKHLQEQAGARRLVGHGTLYKALDRLETEGLLQSEWEQAGNADLERRPRRRLYRITALGEARLAGDGAESNQLSALKQGLSAG